MALIDDYQVCTRTVREAPTFADLLDEYDGAAGEMQLLNFKVGRGDTDASDPGFQARWDQLEERETAAKAAVLAELDRLTDSNALRLLTLFDAPV